MYPLKGEKKMKLVRPLLEDIRNWSERKGMKSEFKVIVTCVKYTPPPIANAHGLGFSGLRGDVMSLLYVRPLSQTM